MLFFRWNATQPFQKLSANDPDEVEQFEKSREVGSTRIWMTLSLFFSFLGIALGSSCVGFYAGMKFTGTSQVHAGQGVDGLLPPAGGIASHIIWNTTFAHLPRDKIAGAWETLYPPGLGHVKHSVLAPDTSTLAVYHQLHCLQAIDTYFWVEVFDKKRPEERNHLHPEKESLPGYPAHIAHCFDYLRQAIICAADTNLEQVDVTLYGANTNIPKKCRDIESVAGWAEKYRSPIAETEEFLHRLSMIRSFEDDVY